MTMYESMPHIAARMLKQPEMIVIKLGGSILNELPDQFYQDINQMLEEGFFPIIVHGGGPAITKMLSQLGIESTFINGLRVTDAQTLDVVQMVLNGKENKEIVKRIQALGGKAIGLSGMDSGKNGPMITAEPLQPELGFVGKVKKFSFPYLSLFFEEKIIPVISPLGMDEQGQIYNINADMVAQAIATELEASKLMMVSDIPGIYQMEEGKKKVLHQLTFKEIGELITLGVLTGGMIPKVEAAMECVKQGIEEVVILDGREEGVLSKVLHQQKIGTKIREKAVIV